MTAVAATPPRLGFATKLAFGLGSAAFGIKDVGFNSLLMLYYNQVLGLSGVWVGIAIAGALISDAFIDPVIGYVSDNWRSRLGRRHPFMYAAALPLAVTYALLWDPPSGLSQVQLTAYLVALTILARSFVSLYEVPSAALIPELTTGYDDRTSVVSYRYFFGLAGSMGTSVLALKVFLQPDATHRVGQLNATGYVKYGYVASALIFAVILVSALGTQAHVRRFPVQLAPPASRGFDFRRSLGEIVGTFSNRGVLPIFGAGLFAGMAFGVGGALLTYVFTFFWQLSPDQMALLNVAPIVSAALGVLLATPISTRFGKRNTAVAMHSTALLVMPAPLVLRLLGLFPANGSALIMPILFVGTMIGSACAIIGGILWYSMTADVVEDSQVKTGRRSEGVLFSSNAFVLKCVTGVGLGISGLVIGLVGFPQHALPGTVPQAVLDRLAVIDVSLVSALYLLAIGCLTRFPISRATYFANMARLSGAQPDAAAAATATPDAAAETLPVAPSEPSAA